MPSLTNININGTNYTLDGGGSSLYLHKVKVNNFKTSGIDDSGNELYLTFISPSSTAITRSSLPTNRFYLLQSWVYDEANGTMIIVIPNWYDYLPASIYIEDGSSSTFSVDLYNITEDGDPRSYSYTASNCSFTDTVVQL